MTFEDNMITCYILYYLNTRTYLRNMINLIRSLLKISNLPNHMSNLEIKNIITLKTVLDTLD